MKQIPYGLTDFSRIQKDNYYYVDKTMFIEKLEMQPHFFVSQSDMDRMAALFENMAFRGDWKPLFDFIAEAIREQSRIREYIEGEAHIKGFLLAYLGMYRYYQLYPEYELNKGFADFLFKPSPSVPVMPPFTYLLEVKYAKAGASENEIRVLADEAREQLLRYSEDELVAEAKAKGGLKLITIIWRSWELVLLEEVNASLL